MKRQDIKLAVYGVFVCLAIGFSGCSNDYFHDTGIADGLHDCSMWEYLQSDPGNWDSTVMLIKRAGLEPLFQGNDSEYPEITFFGPTNLSVLQFLLKTEAGNGGRLYHRVADIPEEVCREMVLSYVVAGRMVSENFDFEVKGTLEGGTVVKTLAGMELRVYRIKGSYMGVPDIGAESLAIHFLESGHMAGVASANISTTSGIVHSLSTTFQFINPSK